MLILLCDINPIKSDVAAYILESWIDSVICIAGNIPLLDCIRVYYLHGSVLQPRLSQLTGSWTCMSTDTEEWEDWEHPRLLKMSINLCTYISLYLISILSSSRAPKDLSAMILRHSKLRLRTMTAQVKSVS